MPNGMQRKLDNKLATRRYRAPKQRQVGQCQIACALLMLIDWLCAIWLSKHGIAPGPIVLWLLVVPPVVTVLICILRVEWLYTCFRVCLPLHHFEDSYSLIELGKPQQLLNGLDRPPRSYGEA